MSNRSLLEYVPSILREEVEDYQSVLPSILGPKMAEEGVEETMHFIRGAFSHQEALREEAPKGGSAAKWFKGTILDVEREARGKTGYKAKITFSDSRSNEEQFIHTGWVKYNFRWNIPYWELALSQTLEAEAKDLIDKEVLLRKAFTTGEENEYGGSRYRFLADIRQIFGASKEPEDDDDEDEDDDDEDGIISHKDIDDLIEDAGIDVSLEDDDYDLIVDISGKKAKKRSINNEVARYLDLKSSDLNIPDEEDYEEMWEYVTLLLASNIDD